MATTDYGLNSNETVKLWSRKLFRESLKQTWMFRFMGRGTNSMIQILDETSKGPGDRVRYILRMLLTGDGVVGDASLEGNEEALVTFTDNLTIDQLRHATRSGGKMSEQRIPFSVREENRQALTDWWADRMDTWLFNQLSGNTGQGNTKYTGLNSVTAPDANHFRFENGEGGSVRTTEASLSAADTTTLQMIDACVEQAKVGTVPIRPIKINGSDMYVMFLHPYQVYDMRRSTSTNDWMDIQKAVLQGGGIKGNPIFSGSLGIYNNTILHESTRVPTITANTRRAIFCGAQAGVIAFSKANSATRMTWVEELFDYGNQLGVSAGLIGGAKKAIFNSEDFGVIAATSYAIAHG